MKKIIITLLLMLVVKNSFATEPFPSEEHTSKSGRYHIVFNSTRVGDRGLFLIDSMAEKEYSFSVEEFGLNYEHQNMMFSSAGLSWYKNSIAVFNKNETLFLIKLGWKRYIALDLENYTIISTPSEISFKLEKESIVKKALELLDSDSPYKRETGAIACNHLNILESIPKLKKLLTDKEFYTTYSGNNAGTIVLYVRKAAKEALLALGENVENVVTELPEKGHLKYYNGQYRLIFNEDNK